MICALCEREVEFTNKHHTIPKVKKGKETVRICYPCHGTIHKMFTNYELANVFYTIEKIQAAQRIQKYLNWIKTKKVERITTKLKKKKKGRRK